MSMYRSHDAHGRAGETVPNAPPCGRPNRGDADRICCSKITTGSFHVERETGANAVLVLSLNEACRIVSVCEGRRCDVSPKVGAVSILPPGSRYAQTITGVACALLYYVPWIQTLNWMLEDTNLCTDRIHPEQRVCVDDDVLARGLFGLAKAAPGAVDEALPAVLDRIVEAHSNRAGLAPSRRAVGGMTPFQLRQIADAVEDRLEYSISLDDLVGVVGISKYHFIRAFKASSGTTPHQYVLRRRLDRAIEMLMNPRADIGEVARLTGFSHASHLSRMLKRRFDVTPLDIRKSVFHSHR